MTAWCKAQQFGDYVDVRGVVEDGNAQLQIIHGHRKQKPAVIKDGRGRRTVELRPAHCDVIKYDWKGSWLRISPRSASGAVVESYRRLLGETFFDDPDFFKPADYTLGSLQIGGQAALDAASSVVRARVTDLVWDRAGAVIRIKATDCLAAVASMGLPVTEGDFIEAKIAVVLPGRREVHRRLHVKVPNRVDYRRDEVHAVAIDAFLESTGIRARESRRRTRDLWDLHPWAHPELTWRGTYPDDVDALVHASVLRATDLTRTTHPDRPHHGAVLLAEATLGISTDEDVPPRLLTPTDLNGLGLSVDALIASWRGALQLHGDLRNLGHGVYVLGERSFDSVHCAIVVLTRQLAVDPTTLVQPMRQATNNSEIGILVPAGRASGTGLPDIPLTRLILDPREVWRSLSRASSVGDSFPAVWRAPRDARMIVDRRLREVWLDGVRLDVTSDSATYKLFAMLAEARGGVVANATIDEALSPNRDESFARKIKLQAKKAIESKVSLDGDEVIVVARGQGYRLGLPSYIG